MLRHLTLKTAERKIGRENCSGQHLKRSQHNRSVPAKNGHARPGEVICFHVRCPIHSLLRALHLQHMVLKPWEKWFLAYTILRASQIKAIPSLTLCVYDVINSYLNRACESDTLERARGKKR
jgi:hypothetical protein